MEQALLEAANSIPEVLKDPQPSVIITDFQSFAIEYTLFVYINDIKSMMKIEADLRLSVLNSVNIYRNKFTDYVSNIHTPVEITSGRWEGRILSPYDFMHLRANRHKEIFLEWYDENR